MGYLQLIHFLWGTFHQKNIQLLGYPPFMEPPSRNLLRAVEVPKLCDYLGPFEALRQRISGTKPIVFLQSLEP